MGDKESTNEKTGTYTQICSARIVNFSDKNIHTLGRTSLDEGSDSRRDSCLKTHKIHNTEICMPSAGFEHSIPANKWPQTDNSEQAEMQKQNAVRILTDGNRCDVCVCTVSMYVCQTVLQCTDSSV
jgi:hypothetical protein